MLLAVYLLTSWPIPVSLAYLIIYFGFTRESYRVIVVMMSGMVANYDDYDSLFYK